jgi:uncharacterized protein (TIRG00374 family)
MTSEKRAAQGPSGYRCENVERDVRQRPRARDDHGYNPREDGDTQNGSQHAASPYHGSSPAASAAAGNVLKGPFAQSVRILVAIGLTALLLWQSDPRAVWQAARGADWRFILLACALVAVDRVLMAYRWWTLLAPVGGRPPLGTVMRIFLVSTFVGTFLPASIGGDAVRAYGLSKEGVVGVDAVASVLMDRLLGVISILIVAIAGAMLARHLIDIRALFPALALLTVACAAALAVVFSPRAAAAVAGVLALLPHGRETGTRLVTAIQRYASLHLSMTNVLLCSIAVQVLRVLQTYCLGLALGLAVPLGVYFALVPLILLIVLMPITINGIGTTQAGFVWLFGRAGVASAPAFALSVLFLGIAVVGNLPGGVLYLLGGNRPRPRPT